MGIRSKRCLPAKNASVSATFRPKRDSSLSWGTYALLSQDIASKAKQINQKWFSAIGQELQRGSSTYALPWAFHHKSEKVVSKVMAKVGKHSMRGTELTHCFRPICAQVPNQDQ
jgi:hypothetical protein